MYRDLRGRHGKGAALARWVVVAGAVMLTGCGRLGFEGPRGGGTGEAASTAYAAVVLADQPLAYWRLDHKTDTAVDASGHGVAGVYGGGVALGVPGRSWTAARAQVHFSAGHDRAASR